MDIGGGQNDGLAVYTGRIHDLPQGLIFHRGVLGQIERNRDLHISLDRYLSGVAVYVFNENLHVPAKPLHRPPGICPDLYYPILPLFYP
ncbi:hypothetical protein ES703_18513 [subsurface metagenome]